MSAPFPWRFQANTGVVNAGSMRVWASRIAFQNACMTQPVLNRSGSCQLLDPFAVAMIGTFTLFMYEGSPGLRLWLC